MRLTKEQAAENRRHILETAGRLFRERGFDGVGVADLMKEAGFTHGGFYNHFDSKEALAAEVIAGALGSANAALAGELRQSRARAWKRFIEHYLSLEHRDDPASGCTVAALAADASRQGPEVKASFTCGFEEVLGIITDHLAETTPDVSPAARREQAVRLWSEVVGAVVLARAVAESNPRLSKEILDTSRRKLLG